MLQPSLIATPRSLSSCISSAIISLSTKSRMVSLASMSVIGISKALNIVAYSTPITPPPITARLRGNLFIFKISSLSKMRVPSKGISSGL